MTNSIFLIRLNHVTDALQKSAVILKPIARDNLSDWADKHFYLSVESSHASGQWSSYPFQKGWMDAFSNDDIEEVVVRKSRRVGYTKTLLAFVAYNIACRRRNQALWWPTDIDRTRFVRDELNPMVRDVEIVQKLLRTSVRDDTISHKKFDGSVLNVLGGNTPRAYRGLTIDVGMIDEISAFDLSIGDAVSPREAVRGRLEGAPNPKLVIGSTPRTKGVDHVDDIAENCQTSMFFYISCPGCKTLHQLKFGKANQLSGFKGYKLGNHPKNKKDIVHVCPHCSYNLTQQEYLKIYHQGEWVSECGRYFYGMDRLWKNKKGDLIKPSKTIAFTIWAAYSPQRTWEDIVEEWVRAQQRNSLGDVGPLKIFYNETLGQSWEDAGETTEVNQLTKKIGNYSRYHVPNDGLILCAGIDTQNNRWEAVTWAYGKSGKMFCVDYSVLRGNPADQDDWSEVLDSYLKTEFLHESGKKLRIFAAAIDVMGHFTTNAYIYCRPREHKQIYAVRGATTTTTKIASSSSQQDVDTAGQTIQGGVRLWSVGTNIAKDLFFQKCKLDNCIHFYDEIDPRFFDSLCAEKRVLSNKSSKWINPHGRRNEALDCTVYSLFCADVLKLLYQGSEKWDRYSRKLLSNKKYQNNKKNSNFNQAGAIW